MVRTSVAILVLSAVLGTEASRPRQKAAPQAARSNVDSSSAIETSSSEGSLSSQVAFQMSGLKDSIHKYMKVWGPHHERMLDQFSLSMLEIKQRKGTPFVEEKGSAGLQQLSGSNSQKEVTDPSFKGYTHYEETGYEDKAQDDRVTKNSELMGTIKVDKEEVPEGDLGVCDAPPGTDPKVSDLKTCLDHAYTYFTDTVTKAWSASHKQDYKDSQVLNLMFDQVLDLSNLRRSLDAFQSDETTVSQKLLAKAKELRGKINTLIIRGEAGGEQAAAQHEAPQGER